MIWIYLSALVFGGSFVLTMVLAGLEFDVDVDGDTDAVFDGDGGLELDTDTGADTGPDAETSSSGSSLSAFVTSLLSFRSLVFFSAFFGLTGAAVTVLGANSGGALVAALALGLAASIVQARALTYLARTSRSSHRVSADLEGRPARVVVPVTESGKGRVRLDLSGQPTFITAGPYMAGDTFDVGANVVIVEIDEGTALIGALEVPNPDSPESNPTTRS